MEDALNEFILKDHKQSPLLEIVYAMHKPKMVKSGQLLSGYYHYIVHGSKEGRIR